MHVRSIPAVPLRFRLAVAAATAAMLAACSSSVPPLHRPDRVDVFCGDRATVATAIESIVASAGGETPEGAAPPPAAAIRSRIQSAGGVIAHWNHQPLYAPKLARSLGIGGDYVTLGDAAIDNRSTGKEWRPIFLTVMLDGGGSKTVGLRAYDVQDVCNQGKLSS